jgi:hypothetical protein
MSRRLIVDFETIGLNTGLTKAYDKLGRTTVLNPTDAFLHFGHVDVTQFAIHDGQTNTIKHYGIDFNNRHKLPDFVNPDSKYVRHLKGFGQVESYLIPKHSERDLESLFGASWSKLQGGKLDWYKKRILPSQVSQMDALFKLPTENGGHIFIAKGNLDLGLKSKDFSVKDGKLIKSKAGALEGIFKKEGVEYAGDFTYEQFQGFLKKNVVNMLKMGTKEAPVRLGAWNPYFDINLYMSELVKMGAADEAKALYTAYQQGIIQTDEVERAYKAFLYQLGKENPELGNMFRIGYNPVAAAATGRPGRVPLNFEEFQYAGGYSAEKAAAIVSKHFGKDLVQGHAAGLDVSTEKQIEKAILSQLNKAGITVDQIIKGDVHGNLSKLLQSENKLSPIIEDLTHQLKPILESYSKYPSMFEGSKMAGQMTEAFKGANKLRWGAMGTIVGLGLLATYGLRGDDSLSPFSDKMKINNLGLPHAPNYSTFFEDKHNSFVQVATIAKGVTGVGAFLYGVGAYSKIMSPRLLNNKATFDFSRKNITDTMFRGLKTIEGSHNITRVLQVGGTIDWFRGDKKGAAIEGKIRKYDKVFKTIRDGKSIGIDGTRDYVHGVDFTDILENSKRLIPEQDYNKLESWLTPKDQISSSAKKIVSKEIRFATADNGAMIVYAQDTLEGGVLQKTEQLTLPFTFKLRNTRHANMSGVNSINRFGKGYGENHITNPTTYWEMQHQQIKSGRAVWPSSAEWMKKQEIPASIKNNPEWKWLWSMYKKTQFNLELGPKGVGESANIFSDWMPKGSANTKTLAQVDQILLPGHTYQNIKNRYREIGVPTRTFMLDRWNRFMESPFELGFFGIDSNKLDKVASKLKSSNSLIKGLAGKALGVINRPHLGLATYTHNMGFLEYGVKFGLKRALPVMAAWEAFRLTDHLLGAITMSPTGRGPLTMGPIKAFEGATLLYSKISDITGFTRLTKKQEKVAPGSTRLGILAPALTATSFFKIGEYLYNKGPVGIKQYLRNVGTRFGKNSFIKNALRTEAYAGALTKTHFERYAGWALRNPKKAIFAAMMVPMLPFLPGVLGSNKTYQERKAEYAGDKEVAVRKYRGWLLSSSPYEGGTPIQFRKHMFSVIESDYENRGVVYPNYWERALHNATFGLYKPYILENYHKLDQPVYESAPLGANIPLIGQPIAATIGRLIKPTRVYHELTSQGTQPQPYTPTTIGMRGAGASNMELARAIGMQSEGSNKDLMDRWSRQYHDLIGFTGFAYETAKQYITGESTDQFVPYKENAGEFYNPAQQMWGWKLGDISGVGGEFLRRIFPYPMKDWKINDLPNELNGVSWIPQESTKKDAFKRYTNDVTHGTTFDNTPLGWLYSTRKGWENLYPELKGKELEQYPDPEKLEILQSIAPFTQEFRNQSHKVMHQTLQDQLSLGDEQRFYETLDQVRQLKDKLYTSKSEYDYRLNTDTVNGTVSSVDESGSFTLEGDDTRYRIAGVSTSEADIRANLLLKEKFSSTSELARAAEEARARTSQIIASRIGIGQSISFQAPSADQMNNSESGTEALIGDLSSDLIEAGAARTNTGNLSEFNMQQDEVGYAGRAMAKYWGTISNDQTFWANKLIPKKDYLDNYLTNQVFNREVKLWSHPIQHLLAPAISSFMHQWFGVDHLPGFTVERRQNQEYWDILKYVKYKMLAVQASKTGNEEDATYYHNMWRSTMIGADPTDDNTRDELAALPENERAYYSRFANEPDPKKRGKIMKYIPRGARRLYNAIWSKKLAESSDDINVQQAYMNLQETEGWGMSGQESKMYMNETGGNANKADWIRARYVREYMKSHDMPKEDWIGYSPDVNIENVELLALKEGGENIQDYGFFDNKLREAVFDHGANLASHQLKSAGSTTNSTINRIVSYIIQDDRASNIQMFPTMSPNTMTSIDIETNGHADYLQRSQSQYGDLIHSQFSYGY